MESKDGRVPFAPHPNCSTVATFAQVIEWTQSVCAGEWSWLRNSRCKYVTVRLDTRAGAHALLDRDGHEITLDELRWQFPRDRDRVSEVDETPVEAAQAGELERLRKALRAIETGETEVFDDDLERLVTVSMCSEEMQEIARLALRASPRSDQETRQ